MGASPGVVRWWRIVMVVFGAILVGLTIALGG
jgi:hypothetical protein